MEITLEMKSEVQATVEDGVWTSENKEIEKLLNDLTPTSYQQLGYWPHPNRMLAEPIIKNMGAKVVYFDKLAYDPDMIY